MRKFLLMALCVTLVPAFASAATQRIVTVKGSGGNYTSLQAAIAGEAKNLVALDRQLTIQCYASAAPDTTQVQVFSSDGWVTDSTHYLRIVVPLSERHSGAFDPTKYYRVMNMYELGVWVLGVPYTRIEGLQFYVSQQNYWPSYPIQLAQCQNCLIDGVLIDAWFGYTGPRHGIHLTVAGGSEVRNTIIYGAWESGIGIYWEPVTISNVTIVNKGLNGNAPYGIDWSTNGATGHVFRNVYCGGATVSCFFGPSGSVTMTKTVSSDTTGTIPNVSLAAAALVNDTGPMIDMHLQPNSLLRGVGVDLSASFTTDCAGLTRTLPWDIGACAFVPSGPPPTPNENFIRALYRDLLSRAPTTSELQQGLSQLSGGLSRFAYVQNVCASADGTVRITNMVQSLVLNNVYQSFLQRAPTAGDVSFGDGQLHSPLTQVLVNILASDEYFQRAQP